MKISKKEVEYVARLARLHLTEEEKDIYTDQLGKILEYIDKLNELDTDRTVPTSHVVDITNVLREDVTKPSLSREEVLSNAPEEQAGHFKVKKVLEDS